MVGILCLVAVLGTVTFSSGAGPGCDTNADVTFILDSSGTVGQTNFNKQKTFVKNIVNDLNVGSRQVQVSAVTFDDLVHNQFYLNQYGDKNSVLNALSAMQYTGGNTHTADAIQYVASQSFSGAHGARNTVPHIAVLVTDGPSLSRDLSKVQAQIAKDNNVIIYTVGVGGGVDVGELKDISSDPDARYFMQADNYDSLDSIANILSAKICNELPPNPNMLPAPTSCLNKADVVFMVDSSSTIGNTNFMKMQNYLKDSIAKMDVGSDKVRVGLMQYSSYPSSEFPLSMYSNRGDVLKAVEKLTLMGGGSNTASAITYARDHMFTTSEGARSNVPRIAVLLTDGGTIDSSAAVAAANAARGANIGFVTVGIGNGVNQQELTSIANGQQHVISVNNFDQLDSTINNLLSGMCGITSSVDYSQVVACTDKISNCAEYGSSVCNNYQQWANDNCKSFCGKCSYQFTKPLPQCVDQINNCHSYGKDICSSNAKWANDNCKRYCGLCEGNGAVGFYGRCAYKGKSYITGEKWRDGCDYDCVCEDGNSGKYHCYNQCPVYYNLPSFCTLVRKPGECCLQPVCNFKQNIHTFESTGAGQTADGIKVCEYNGKQYFERQSWKDGCRYSCTCTDASRGAYRCEQLCPTYQVLPSSCRLVRNPGECCQKPVCEFNQQHGSFSGSGSVSGSGSGISYTPPDACKDKLSNCQSYGKQSCRAQYHSWAAANCAKFCGICSDSVQIPVPGPNDVCIYEGRSYKQGQTWSRGCGIECVCEDASHGYFRCNNRCPTYNNIPAGCNEKRPEGYCCTTVECQTGTFYSSANNYNSIGNGGALHILNPTNGLYNVPTMAYSGQPIGDGSGGTGFTPPTIDGCLYKGRIYGQNQAFDDGCDKSCVCLNSTSGQYACRDKCPAYHNLGNANCVQISDPNEPCCTIPKCGPNPSTGQAVVPVPVFQPSVTGIGQVQPPVPGSTDTELPYTNVVILNHTGFTPAPPTVPANIDKSGFCVAKDGTHYSPGQSWEEGCDYNCICDNGKTGHYTCIDKCYKYDYVPQPYCHKIQDPVSPCCSVVECYAKPHGEEFTGVRTTPRPHTNVCNYKDEQYQQGQTWYDDCSSRCTCEDALNGIYRCTSRCPAYLETPQGCTQVPDPRDPTCCMMPSCTPQGTINSTSGNNPVPQPQPLPLAVYPGQVHEGTGHVPGVSGYCVYKGAQYTSGQKWQDGCDFNCECKDAEKGYYECTDMCQRFTGLPSQCRLVPDFSNPCCKKPECDIPTQTGSHDGSGHPTGSPTPAPNTLLPPTLPPRQQFCVYKGVNYIQGEEWEDGCSYKCRCDDSSRGLYTCNQRCSDFGTLKPGCTLKTDPRDQCCVVPVCYAPTLGPNQPRPTGPTPVPTAPPQSITGQVHLPTPSPIPGQPSPTPKYPLGFCMYGGNTYLQGQKWDDGCDYTCVCVNASTGAYRCDNKCPRYLELPPECRLVKDPHNPCCQITECYKNPTPNPTPHVGGVTGSNPVTVQPGHTVSQNPGNTVNPGHTVSPTPGVPYTGPPTIAPLPSVTPRPTQSQPIFQTTPAPFIGGVCVYKGKSYTQGQQWYDGCDFTCVCEDGSKGVYRCSNRCPTYPNPGPYCTMQPSPSDPLCCKVPVCATSKPNQPYVTRPLAVVTGGAVTPTPTLPTQPTTPPPRTTPTTRPPLPPGQTYPPTHLFPTPSPPTQPTTPSPVYKEKMCVYKGKQYAQGQRWQDGCDYDCVCEDGQTGLYKCTQKCPTITDLKPGCRLIRDYNNPCCQKPYCAPTANPPVTLHPPTGTTVTNSPPAYCVYNGAKYSQGQSWDDGCDLRCVCEDATSGFYRCTDRCPHFGALPQGCYMETDPNDACCRQPKCIPDQMVKPTPQFVVPTMRPGEPTPVSQGPIPNPTSPVPTIPPRVYQGSGKPQNLNACRYKGVDYKQGQTWQDGCSLNCECIDDHTGRYSCTQRCPAYNNVAQPPNCYLVVNPNDQCCKIYQCTQPSTPAFTTPHSYPPGYTGTPGTGLPPVHSGTRPTGPTHSNPLNPTNNPPINPTNNPPINPTNNPPINPTINPPNTPYNPYFTQKPTPSPTPKPGVCVYKGVQYAPGQQWYDGCSQKCVCEPGMTGYYRCSQRCASYPSIPTGCTLVPDSNDPQCCQIPRCFPSGSPNPSLGPVTIPTVQGVITGFGTSTPNPPTVPYNPYNPNNPYNPTNNPQNPYNPNNPTNNPQNPYNPNNPTNNPQNPYNPNSPTNNPQNPNNPNNPTSNPQNPNPGTNNPYSPTPGRPGMPVTNSVGNPVTDTLGHTVTYAPTPGYTQRPTPGNNNPSPTPSPLPKNVCVYKGQAYQTGQKWQDGCKYNCICEDGMTGKYVCTERCSVYPNLPLECTLKRDTKDFCCMVPVCDYSPTTTPRPTLTPPINPPTGETHPTPANTPPPAFCVYKGVAYQQGQTWNEGCTQKCRCDNAMQNIYTCYDRCASYPNLPQGCTKIVDPNDACCLIPQCPQVPLPVSTPRPTPHYYPPGYTGPTESPIPSYTPQPTPHTYPPGYTGPTDSPRPSYTEQPTPRTYPPGYTGPTESPRPHYTGQPTPGVNNPNTYPIPALPQGVITGTRPSSSPNNPIPNAKSVCEYKGVQYSQGQKWTDGCSYACECIDSTSGHYACTEKCRRFPPLPSNCYMVQDQNDQCCKVPFCAPTPSPLPKTTPGPTPKPHTGPSGQTVTPGPTYVPPQVITTPGPIPFLQPREVCIMNGKTYTQGQTWFNGCDQKCVCTDGKTGYYSCTSRCPVYDIQNLPRSCTMTPDPKDPLCCKVPKCENTNTLRPPVIIGTNPVTTPQPHIIISGPGPTSFTHSDKPNTPPPEVCVYKGQQYQQGQRWQDGCAYICQCVDASIGRHKCIERCSSLTNIPLACKLKYNPQDPCCPTPDCPQFIVPTPGPNGIVPSVPTNGPLPQTEFCVYNGVPYRQGQSWNVGCEKRCVCDDASTGQINCNDRCPTYPPQKDGCQLLTDPNDQCCQAPLCINPNPQNPYNVVSGSKGSIEGTSQPTGPNPQFGGVVSQRNVCLYHGKTYTQGQKWEDGCLYQCECLDSSTGRYRCTERCARQPQVPSYCTMVQDSKDSCCQIPYCPLSNPTPGPTGTPNPLNPNPSGNPPQPSGTFIPTPLSVCVYDGQVYRQGQQWYKGCDLVCRCENATSGFYRCQQRCTKYPSIPSGCTLTADPQDPQCCKVPDCPVQQPQPGVTPTPGLVYPPNPIYGGVTGFGPAPTPQATPVPTVIGPHGIPVPATLPPGVSPQPKPTATPGCMYKGRLYSKGQQWDDGCQYHCQCLDDMTGKYQCNERCSKYPNLPQYCTLVQDPRNPCCGVPYCDQKNPSPTVPSQYHPYRPSTQQPQYIRPSNNPPISGSAAPLSPKSGYCVYNGVYYKQGDTWNDGCKQHCQCDDSQQGLYSCKQRCPTFTNLPNNCHLVADRNDPCCVVPDCNTFPTPYPTAPGFTGATQALPVVLPTPVQQSFTGHGNPPNFNPLYPDSTGSQKACVYNGKIYQQGQQWEDGCKYSCTCFDAERGLYKCQNKCPAYYNLPAQCQYITDPANPCCKKASCDMNQLPPTTQRPTPAPVYTTQPPRITNGPIGTKPPNMCKYSDNSLHQQGAKWDVGCQYKCQCENATFNSYRCEQRCTVFGALPSICTLIPDPQDACCKVPKCQTQSGINLNPVYGTTNGSATPPPGTLNIIPIGTHSFNSGATWHKPGVAQGTIGGNTGGIGVCVYKGKIYNQGQSWDDGCDYVCTCENALRGEYTCISKCPQLPASLPAYCKSLSIPGECCPKVTCDIAGMNQVYRPDSEVFVTPAPTDVLGNKLTPPPHTGIVYNITGTQPVTSGVGFPGQGFPITQPQFYLVKDQCIFHGKDGFYRVYNEGETWNDGCDFDCECKDGKSGYYECTPRCPLYNNLPSGHCTIIKVDGKCCSEPRCFVNGESINPLETQSKYTVYGTVNGIITGLSPNYNYNAAGTYVTNNFTGNSNDCIYKGLTHKPGSSWNDGCAFMCKCEDHGRFTCQPRCPVYTSLPSFCKMVSVDGVCCKQVQCDQSHNTQNGGVSANPITTLPPKPTCSWCKDEIDNCEAYGHQACVAPYQDWANRNCKSYCNFCDCDHTTPAPTTPTTQPSDCHDKLDVCSLYGRDSCVGAFEPWARENCKYFCGFCGNNVGPGAVATTASSGSTGCFDEQPEACANFGSTVCTNVAYTSWAKINCKKTCNFCAGNTAVTAAPKHCTYTDGNVYNVGQTWIVGCEKNCSCQSDGVYRCNQLCPIYEQLPSNWVLVKVQGQCCPVVHITNQNQCHYKGHSYNENEQWQDGCKLNCVCTDGKNGLYACKEKCPEWNIPAACHWEDPKPGKCCHQPKCPPQYTFDKPYPDE